MNLELTTCPVVTFPISSGTIGVCRRETILHSLSGVAFLGLLQEAM